MSGFQGKFDTGIGVPEDQQLPKHRSYRQRSVSHQPINVEHREGFPVMTSRDARRHKEQQCRPLVFRQRVFQACALAGCLFQRASAARLALSDLWSGVSDRRERLPSLTAFGFFLFSVFGRFFLFRVFERLYMRDIVRCCGPVVYRKVCERSDQSMRTLAFQKFLDRPIAPLYLEGGPRKPAAAVVRS